jgi:3-oxoacyl-[acyl-carrier protein] reductase
MITAVLAKELAPRKIRVNSINPGLVETEGTHTAGIMGTVFLASDDAGWLTGKSLLPAAVFNPRALN